MSDNNSINWLGNKVMDSNPQKAPPNMRDRTYIPASPAPAASQNMAMPPNVQASPATKNMTSPVETNPAHKNMTSPAEMNTKMYETEMDEMPYQTEHMPSHMDRTMPVRNERYMRRPLEDSMPSQMEQMHDTGLMQDAMMQQGRMSQIPPSLRTDDTFQEGPPPVMNKLYIPGYLESLIGRTIRAEFVIGTNQSTDRSGRLIEVGVNYFVLEDLLSRNHIMCDLYSVKFVTVMR